MTATVRDLIFALEVFFPGEMGLRRALYVLVAVVSLWPLLRLHALTRLSILRKKIP